MLSMAKRMHINIIPYNIKAVFKVKQKCPLKVKHKIFLGALHFKQNLIRFFLFL